MLVLNLPFKALMFLTLMRPSIVLFLIFFFFQAEDGIRDLIVIGVQTCALPISRRRAVLRYRARGDVYVYAVVLEHLRVEAELGGVRPKVRARGARRLLHHLAE